MGAAEQCVEQYAITARGLAGNRVDGYQIKNCRTWEPIYVDKATLCFMIGRGEISNAKAQMYKDDIIIQGVGCKISELPTIRVTNNGNPARRDTKTSKKYNTTSVYVSKMTREDRAVYEEYMHIVDVIDGKVQDPDKLKEVMVSISKELMMNPFVPHDAETLKQEAVQFRDMCFVQANEIAAKYR